MKHTRRSRILSAILRLLRQATVEQLENLYEFLLHWIR